MSAGTRSARGSEPLLLEKHVYDMIRYGYVCLRRFPNAEKHTLCADVKVCMYTMLRLVVRAKHKHFKKTTLQEFDIENQTLITLVRLAKDLAFLPFKQYESWVKMLIEIGKMIGGWIKHHAIASR